MIRTVSSDIAVATRETDRRLAFGIFAAPLAWLIHEIAGAAIVGDCMPGMALAAWQWWTLAALAVFSLGLVAAGGVTAYHVLQRCDGRLLRAQGWDRVEFLALFGLFMSGLLLLHIVYFGVLPLSMESCVRAI